MAKMSDLIEVFIKELLEDNMEHMVEIQRNELAQYFKCAPSQINYVLTTRFPVNQGYVIESQRGGGGYIKISKITVEQDDLLMTLLNEIGDQITNLDASRVIQFLKERGIITQKEAAIMNAAISDRSISAPINIKNEMRAKILKNMILSVFEINA